MLRLPNLQGPPSDGLFFFVRKTIVQLKKNVYLRLYNHKKNYYNPTDFQYLVLLIPSSYGL